MDNKIIKNVLLKTGCVENSDVTKAEEFARAHKTSILDYLFAKDILNNDVLGQAIAEYLGISYADLSSLNPKKELVLLIPEELATKYKIVVFKQDAKEISIATDSFNIKEIEKIIKKIFPKKKIKLSYALTEDIVNSFIHYKKSLATKFEKIIKKGDKIAPEIFTEIVKDAVLLKSSDIHFEPNENDVLVRFRVDGILQEAGTIQKEYYSNLINLTKVLAGLRIDESETSQDGSIKYSVNNEQIDLRLSIVPTINGEKIVLRILSGRMGGLKLSDIGLMPTEENLVLNGVNKPFGMILVVGPTGSGKTTTLYSILKTLDKDIKNITTIEDPVEYRISKINQIQVNKEKGLTFAKGLRSIVRQDPDVILIGEIRDKETAEIGVNAALTGHLVLSTFHANNAASTIPRLIDMGIERFLLSSTLELIIAQRLARKICENCRTSITLTKKDTDRLPKEMSTFFAKEKTVYKGKGCPVCNHTGYRGRTSLFEIIKITPEIKELINSDASSAQIWSLAKKQGSSSMFIDGIKKIKSGITSIEEVLRVSPPS